MIYLDTSILVAALTNEPNSAHVQEWLQQQDANALWISDWGVAEFSSALSIKLRTGQITTSERADVLAGFHSLCAETFAIQAVSRDNFRSAARLSDQAQLALRAADALHLAICSGMGASLSTLDRRMQTAAPAFGVKLEPL